MCVIIGLFIIIIIIGSAGHQHSMNHFTGSLKDSSDNDTQRFFSNEEEDEDEDEDEDEEEDDGMVRVV